MAVPGYQSETVKARFDAYDEPVRRRLLELRALIFATAGETDGIGPLEETLKWNEPAYLNPAGTTIRLNAHKGSESRYALYVHCQTDLIARYRQFYGDLLCLESNRAVIFDCADALPADAVKHCIAMALTYRLK